MYMTFFGVDIAEWAREHIRWFGQSAFRISAAAGPVIFIDPVRVPADAGPADLILISHPHPDHYNGKTIARLSGPGTTVVMPGRPMTPGSIARFGQVGVTAVAAYNVSKRFHPRERGWLGYVIEVDGLRIYHAGDTDPIPEMSGLRPDIALLPIGGMFTMDRRGAAQAARSTGARLCIPMHFNLLIGGRKAGEKFCREAGPGCLVLPRG